MQFREFVVQEGDLLKSIVFGVRQGIKKFNEKPTPPPEKKVSEKKQILNQLMSATNDKDLSAVVEKMIQNNLRLTANGELKKPNKNWLMERHVHAQKRNHLQKGRGRRPAVTA
jgi:hypothetical protein